MKRTSKKAKKTTSAKPIKVASSSRENKSPDGGGQIFVGEMVALMMKAAEAKRKKK